MDTGEISLGLLNLLLELLECSGVFLNVDSVVLLLEDFSCRVVMFIGRCLEVSLRPRLTETKIDL